MRMRRGVGRTEVIVGIAVAAALVAVAVPLAQRSSKKSHRQELIQLVDEIRIAQITYHEAFDEYVAADPAPRPPDALDGSAVPWRPSPGFVRLAWEPSRREVYGSYRVKAGPDGFTVVGTSDLDGDGVHAVVQATADRAAHLVTEEDVY